MTQLSALESLKLSRSPSPLSLYLTIYSKANSECYIDYMEGAIALKNWLGKIELPLEKYPEISNPNFSIPRLLGGYESSELAKVLSEYKINHDLASRMATKRAIYFVMTKEVASTLN